MGASTFFGNILAAVRLAIPVALILAVLWYRHEARTEHEARVAWQHTGQAYKAAQRASAALREATNARVVAQQTKVTNDVEAAFLSRLRDVRARYDGLRRQAAASGGNGQQVPGTSAGTGIADGPAEGDGLLAILQAADENTAQLIELQNWVRQQAAVDPNAP